LAFFPCLFRVGPWLIFLLLLGRTGLSNEQGKRARALPFALSWETSYFASGVAVAAGAASAVSPAFLRLSQLYFFWNFSTRPVVSTNFILPVKNGWHAEQISVLMFFFVLRVTNLLPQPQVTVVSSYFGWMSFFIGLARFD